MSSKQILVFLAIMLIVASIFDFFVAPTADIVK
jgi:hypothetical protein